MNKAILSILLVFFLVVFVNALSLAPAKKPVLVKPQPPKADLSCRCEARSITKCGLGENDGARKCRREYIENCNVRCAAETKCSTQIKEKCSSFKEGTKDFKHCKLEQMAKHCSSLVVKDEKNCSCKVVAHAICGSHAGPLSVRCRDYAFEGCKQTCKAAEHCDSKKRICITEANCNCRTLAKRACEKSESKDCEATSIAACEDKCKKSSRCYRLSCHQAGQSTCEKAVAEKCAKFSADEAQKQSCVQKETKECLAFELATCHKARRLYKFRKECDFLTQVKCGKLAGAEKCKCVSTHRNQCVKDKEREREEYIRKQEDCKKRVARICGDKVCHEADLCAEEEMRECLKEEKREDQFPPKECVETARKLCDDKVQSGCFKRVARRCGRKWFGRYCENGAFVKCNADVPCMKQEIKNCERTLPKCTKKRELCKDNNVCTYDVCDPHVGCLNVPKDCNDNNACTTDICDPVKGCVHTAKKCDDGIACTADSCDSRTGQCVHEREHTKCASDDVCSKGICSDKGCIYHKEKDTKKCPIPEIEKLCQEQCKPNNACEEVDCLVDTNLKFTCKRSTKSCDDGRACTVDSCDAKTGLCVHTPKNTKECPTSTPLCDDNLDCAAWAVANDLHKKCFGSTCDVKLGICVEVELKDKSKCGSSTECICSKRDACDISAQCVPSKQGLVCQRVRNSCDDNNECTEDFCDTKSGKCTHTFKKTPECESCGNDRDCVAWATKQGLEKLCKGAVCDGQKKCKIVDMKDKSKCVTPDCISCKARNPCETATCVFESSGKPVCKYTQNTCDDSNPCTVDTCDVKTGKCVNKATERPGCSICKTTADCKKLETDLKLAQSCKEAVCHVASGECKIQDKKDKSSCNPGTSCPPCAARNPCEIARCVELTGVCELVKKNCDDLDPCTVDTCDAKTGKCVNEFKADDKKCFEQPVCKVEEDCKAWGEKQALAGKCKKAVCDTKTGKCVSTTTACPPPPKECDLKCASDNLCERSECQVTADGPKCVTVSKKVCDAETECTKDSCDAKTGLCITAFKKSDKCFTCVSDVDCKKMDETLKLANNCKRAVCDDKSGLCKVIDSVDTCKKTPICDKDCVAKSACETVECVFSEGGNPVCARTTKTCDDKDECTVDTCDAKTGNCVHKSAASPKCPPVCKSEVDCKAWGESQKLAEKCQEAVCDTQKGGCKVQDKKDKSKCTTPICPCRRSNACEEVECLFTDNGTPSCKATQRVCDDNNACTIDSCDAKTGNCVFTFKKTAECQPCAVDKDCEALANSEGLVFKCMSAVCDKNLGVCKTFKLNKECVCDTCVPRSPCERAECVVDAKKELSCKRTSKCDDGKDCTVDTCDLQKNVCVSEFVKSDKCIEQCVDDSKCIKMATDQKLGEKCKTSVCNKKTGSCEIVDTDNKFCVPKEICDKECKPANACESVGCAYNELKQVVCKRVQKDCNDNKECTKDSCDTKTGLCKNEFVRSELCREDCAKDCVAWAKTQGIDLSCRQVLCNSKTGSCEVVKDTTNKCVPPKEVCEKFCKAKDACEEVKDCQYDVDAKIVCKPTPKSCDDKKECTKDSCDPVKGCVNEFVKSDKCTNKCEKTEECKAWEVSAKLADKCEEAFCDPKLGACVAIKSANKKCTPPEIKKTCEETCVAANKCETATCVVDENNKFTCKRTKLTCDDGKACTKDFCDEKTEKCVNQFVESEKCTTVCETNLNCVVWGINNKLSDECKIPKCNLALGACEAVDAQDSTCIPEKKKCEASCKPANACQESECIKNEVGKFVCSRKERSCDDNKACTVDSCDAKTGKCVNEFKSNKDCPTPSAPCDKDLDCKAWGVANNLFAQCKESICDTKLGMCKAVASQDTQRCDTGTCNVNSDCPDTKHGAVCEVVKGTRKCIPHECTFTSDCVKQENDPSIINVCKKKEGSAQRVCVPTKKCERNLDCDDNDPCSTDICWSEYGICKNLPKCDDDNVCTEDIAIPSKDKKTCTCYNKPQTCAKRLDLVKIPFELVTEAQKKEWLGLCIKEEGCRDCVIDAQCDDDNGCTADSCEEQKCIHKPIHNEWCDPKIVGQPIRFQSIPGLRDKLILAGYDIDKLAN